MLKTLVLVTLLCSLPMSFVLTGCGPKLAKPETMTELEAAKSAAEAAEAEVKELQAELLRCGKEKSEKESKIKDLERQIDALKSEGK
ncbi:hypothetical protein AMJ40_02890 [candidate division TA06 bacterium DG_26]|uniref:Uncharacterized protein n=1 Tax=candidate division TA06 bacterium DG_26 TaxID=1703771 RepID=A0A0S7WJW9_UNCT6|nr:MAG: hypothetical protein AMJ40_02890 [candidate division TA06 bacterium DG_26]